MFTRSFLFLLAIVTGFSAANAGDGLRHTPAAIGASASAVQSVVAVWGNEAVPAKAHSAILMAVPFDAAGVILPLRYGEQIVDAARVYIGDRNRQ
jgi:hypothetical protein